MSALTDTCFLGSVPFSLTEFPFHPSLPSPPLSSITRAVHLLCARCCPTGNSLAREAFCGLTPTSTMDPSLPRLLPFASLGSRALHWSPLCLCTCWSLWLCFSPQQTCVPPFKPMGNCEAFSFSPRQTRGPPEVLSSLCTPHYHIVIVTCPGFSWLLCLAPDQVASVPSARIVPYIWKSHLTSSPSSSSRIWGLY